MTDTEDSIPFCSKCDASMVRRMDMETAKWFCDCPKECIGTKPRKKPKDKKVDARPVEEAPVMTNAVGGIAKSLSEPDVSPEMTALDERLAEIERKIAARRATNVTPVIDVAGDVTPCPQDRDRLYYNSATDKLMVHTADGSNVEVVGSHTPTCPGLAQDKTGALRLCGRPTEVLNGVPNKDRLCWVHASPVGSVSVTPEVVWTRWTARIAALLAITALFGAMRSAGASPAITATVVFVAVIVTGFVTRRRA